MAKTYKNRLVILDGNAIVHRGYHAIPPLHTKEGVAVNAVYGFTSILLKVLKDLQPTHIVATFDLPGPTFRDELYEEYKATRVKADDDLYDQFPLVHEMVDAFAIANVAVEGFEADDCIGTIAKKATSGKTGQDTEVIVVTGDMDTLQLVSEQVTVRSMRKGMSDIVTYDVTGVMDRMKGLTPEQVIDYKAIKGDSSDNIKGVKGIGDKGATDLLLTFKTLDGIYSAIDAGDERIKGATLRKLIEGKESAYLSQELATIRLDVPLKYSLAAYARKPVHQEQVLGLLQEFEFTSLLSRIPGLQNKVKAVQQQTAIDVVEVTQDALSDLCKSLTKEKQVGMVLEHGNGSFLDVVLGGVCLATTEKAWFVSAKLDGWERVLACDTQYLGHNIKEDCKILWQSGIEPPKQMFDLMVGSYLIHSESRAHDLPALALKYLGENIAVESKQESLFGKPVAQLGKEVRAIVRIAQEVMDQMQDDELMEVYQTIDGPLIPVLGRMESNGVAINDVLLGKLAKSTDAELETLTSAIHKEAGQEFNVNSSTQLREILFNTLGLPTDGIKKGKTGYSTAASELEKLNEFHPIIAMIERHRELMKLKTTYIDVLPTLLHSKTGRIHSTFNQTVAATGRLSSSDPNLQNIPIRTDAGRKIRDAFVAESGNLLVVADYSQIELRIVAHLAQDKELIRIFTQGEDVHTSTAAKIHGVAIEDVTKDMRRSAKEVNFGVLYGMGAFGLASRTGISRVEAQEFIAKYFEAFSGVKQYLDDTLAFAQTHGYVETLFGRRRYTPHISASNFQVRATAERMAINHPVQGTAADVMKLAMISLDAVIADDPDCAMIMQVHDELVFEVPEKKAKDFATIVKRHMEDVFSLDVPVDVEVEIGPHWGAAK